MNQVEAANIIIAGVITAYKRGAFEMNEVGPLSNAITALTTPIEQEKVQPQQNPNQQQDILSENPYANQQ